MKTVWALTMSCAVTACSGFEVVPPGRDACLEKRQELVQLVRQTSAACQADADCTVLEPRATGQCGVATGNGEKTTAMLGVVQNECDAVPQMKLDCLSVLPACVAGRCVAQPVDHDACTGAAEPSAEALRAADASCTTDSECAVRKVGNELFALRSEALSKLEGLDVLQVKSCSRQAAGVPPTCESSRCTPHGVEVGDVTRPEIDLPCLFDAFRSTGPIFSGSVSFRARVNVRGQINYFEVLKGPHEWTQNLLIKVAHCQAKPAMFRGKPISDTSLFSFQAMGKR